MADKTESELNTVEQAVYHDIDDNELSMLLKVNQLSGKFHQKKDLANDTWGYGSRTHGSDPLRP